MPSFVHKPVLLSEVLAGLNLRPGACVADGTLGGAGHAVAMLTAASPGGRLYGCDRDGAAIEAATARLNDAGFSGRFEIHRGNYSELADWVPPASCDAVLLDLGVSSPQIDEPGRGFSFQHDGPLDMRMDLRQPLTAAALVNSWSEAELARIFREYGDEPQARRFARAIAQDRAGRPFETTLQLASLIERLAPRFGSKKHPATRVFQALRTAVNDESHFLTSGLAAACTLLKPGGRLAVITFHSLEDRMVKEFGRERARDYTFPGEVDVPELRTPIVPELKWVQRKAIVATEAELAENPRARSAQLRLLEKI